MRTCDSNLSWKQADLPPFLLRGHSKPGNAKPTGPPMAWQEHHVWPACLVSYQDVMQASAVEKEAWAGMQGEGHFLHATESNYAKGELLSDKDKREDKGKRLTPLYRGGGCCYCCSQIRLSPVHIWWMNHLAIGQAASATNRKASFALWPPQRFFYITETNEKFSSINSLGREIISKCLSQPLIQSHNSGNCLETTVSHS